MTYNAHKSTALTCSATISKKRNRVKSYVDPKIITNLQYHLKDGDEFEIELFNPLSHQVLAKIQIKGNDISSSGIVLLPGQRIFLERFIDTNEKFVFKTYAVENTPEAKGAIGKNGDILVQFFNEDLKPDISINLVNNYNGYTIPFPSSSGTFVINNSSPLYSANNIPSSFTLSNSGLNLSGTTAFSNLGSITNSGTTKTSINLEPGAGVTFNSTTLGNSTTNNAFNPGSMNSLASDTTFSSTIETGRVSGGTASTQSFETVYGRFLSFTSATVRIKILPESLKPIEASEIRNYCTGCGTRVKKSSWKFCPSCGEKF